LDGYRQIFQRTNQETADALAEASAQSQSAAAQP
jgi:hypothetical protein